MSVVSFRAHKNGTNQTGVADNVDTQVTFGTEVFDNGSFFASNTWTPPSGVVLVGAAAQWTGTISAGLFSSVSIRKNSTQIAWQQQAEFTNVGVGICWGFATCNGSDTFTVWVQGDLTSGTASISGAQTDTYFWGTWFAAESNLAPSLWPYMKLYNDGIV